MCQQIVVQGVVAYTHILLMVQLRPINNSVCVSVTLKAACQNSSHTKEHLINNTVVSFLQRRQAREWNPHTQTGTWPRCRLSQQSPQQGWTLINNLVGRIVWSLTCRAYRPSFREQRTQA